MVVGECPIARGETLSLSIAAANRDDVDLSESRQIRHRAQRHSPPSRSAPAGHFCLGAPFARAVAREALLGLVVQFPQLGTQHTRLGIRVGARISPHETLLGSNLTRRFDIHMTNAMSDISFWFDSIGELPPPAEIAAAATSSTLRSSVPDTRDCGAPIT